MSLERRPEEGRIEGDPKPEDSSRERKREFKTDSGFILEPLYTPEDIADLDYEEDLGSPGEPPFTRGIYETMYRGRLWTIRNAAGFGDAIDTNERIRHQFFNGQTGVSVAFDLPTIYGYDADMPDAYGEFGHCGVNCSSLEDMELLFKEVPLDKVSVSLTSNAHAPVILAMFIATAEKQGVPIDELKGTTQNDMIKEYVSQKEYIFPPEPSLKLSTDIVEFCTENMPNWNTINISGYHMREDGATAPQEVGFTIANAIQYVRAAKKRGLSVDEFVPRFSFYFSVGNEFLEEVAKMRAARRIWTRVMEKEFGAEDKRAMRMKIHAHTAGSSLTAQQPENNIVRTSLQAMAAALGGAQSIHVSSMDEALSLPSEHAATVALMTQAIIAEETGIVGTIDPLGGSYLVEKLTNEIEKKAIEYMDEIEDIGGAMEALKSGYFRAEIDEGAKKRQEELDSGERVVVGVNKYQVEEKVEIPVHRTSEESFKRQVERLQMLRRERDNGEVKRSLEAVKQACIDGDNLLPSLIDAAKSYATLGEIVGVMKEVYGEYTEPSRI